MKVLFILLSVLFCLWVMQTIRRNKRLGEASSEQFWQREAQADSTRKQDITQLNYIHLPLERLPFGVDTTKEVREIEATLYQLADKKILNLNSYSNTDLKLMYGVANLAFLSECDDRFTILSRTLYQWACLLSEHGNTEAAIQAAKYCIETGSDISGCYYMLSDYYQATGNEAAMKGLRESASALTGLNANAINEYLNKSPI